MIFPVKLVAQFIPSQSIAFLAKMLIHINAKFVVSFYKAGKTLKARALKLSSGAKFQQNNDNNLLGLIVKIIKLLSPLLIVIFYSSYLSAKQSKHFEIKISADSQTSSRDPYSFSVCERTSLSKIDSDKLNYYFISPGYFHNGNSSYQIVDSDIRFHEILSYAKLILAENGFVEARTPEESEIKINISYGILDNAPISVGTKSTTAGKINTLNGRSTYSGTTTSKPAYVLKGKFPYSRFIRFDAVATREKQTCAWTTIATIGGDSREIDDFRNTFPYILVAMKPHIRKYNENLITVKIPIDDPGAIALKSLK